MEGEDGSVGSSEKPMTKSQLKKLAKIKAAQEKKAKKEQERLMKEEEKERKRFELALSINVQEDPSLPSAETIKIVDALQHVSKRVKICGWVHHIRQQGKLLFLVLRDGTGFIQSVISGDLALCMDAITLHREAAVSVTGELLADERAQGGVEIQADYWEVIGKSDGDIENILTHESSVDILFDNRHIVIRGTRTSSILKLRAILLQCIRSHYSDGNYFEVTTPTLVQTMCEGGSTLFNFNYYGETAYLTQSSQMYLETAMTAMGNVYCVMPSYRAEKSKTRRHLSEYTHIEAEMPFITFENLLEILEDLMCDVVERLKARGKEYLKTLNSSFLDLELKRPFKRMEYSEAINFCIENQIFKDEDEKIPFELGDDISEAPERRMIDMIGEPVFLIKFPREQKSFYMARCEDDPSLTESVDLLMPGVGEVIGGSMRLTDLNKLMDEYKKEGMDPNTYYWYCDVRKYGTCPHGGYGIGLERLLMWIANLDHIRETCLYPRYMGRCRP